MASLLSFAIHIFVFNELWDYILQGKSIEGYSKSQLIWYIIIAEFIIYSYDTTFRKIAQMVKQGDIANMLIKPVDMISYFIAESSSNIIKVIVNAVFGVILGITFAGPINVSFSSLVFTIVACMIGIFNGICLQILIGILAFFTEENKSFRLVIQKMIFFVVFTPLEFYPSVIQKILSCLPTTYMVYAPAKIFTNFDMQLACKLIFYEIISFVFVYSLLRVLYRKGVKNINVNGG
jgi:ABC-2 type transport system permease protein